MHTNNMSSLGSRCEVLLLAFVSAIDSSSVVPNMSSRLYGILRSALSSLQHHDIVALLHRPVDAASLGICRVFFGNSFEFACIFSDYPIKKHTGLTMLIDIAEERGGSSIRERWADPERCHFPIFEWIQPLPMWGMCSVYAVMWLGTNRQIDRSTTYCHIIRKFPQVHWVSRWDFNIA